MFKFLMVKFQFDLPRGIYVTPSRKEKATNNKLNALYIVKADGPDQ